MFSVGTDAIFLVYVSSFVSGCSVKHVSASCNYNFTTLMCLIVYLQIELNKNISLLLKHETCSPNC